MKMPRILPREVPLQPESMDSWAMDILIVLIFRSTHIICLHLRLNILSGDKIIDSIFNLSADVCRHGHYPGTFITSSS